MNKFCTTAAVAAMMLLISFVAAVSAQDAAQLKADASSASFCHLVAQAWTFHPQQLPAVDKRPEAADSVDISSSASMALAPSPRFDGITVGHVTVGEEEATIASVKVECDSPQRGTAVLTFRKNKADGEDGAANEDDEEDDEANTSVLEVSFAFEALRDGAQGMISEGTFTWESARDTMSSSRAADEEKKKQKQTKSTHSGSCTIVMNTATTMVVELRYMSPEPKSQTTKMLAREVFRGSGDYKPPSAPWWQRWGPSLGIFIVMSALNVFNSFTEAKQEEKNKIMAVRAAQKQ